MVKQKPKMSPSQIRELLRLRQWSQAELGRQVGVHESSVSLWLSGNHEPNGSAQILLRRLLEEAQAAQPATAGK